MRIISGIHKGRRLKAPKNLPVRPTTDMAKEGLFNVLRHRFALENVRVLDLYAGTGNISYEFASRGCPEVIAVDRDPGCVRFIQHTARELDLPITAYRKNAMTFLETARGPFDIVFADPPYAIPEAALHDLVGAVLKESLLADGGLLVLEHAPQNDLSGLPGVLDTRKYGSSVLSFVSHDHASNT